MLSSGLALSLVIELSQLLNPRRTDVDDLLMNTLGAFLGLLLFRTAAAICKPSSPATTPVGYQPLLYIAVLFAGRFLLFYGLGTAALLYGF